MNDNQKFYMNELSKGRIGRREFIGRMGAAGISVAAIPSLLSRSAYAGAPKVGGKIAVGIEAYQSKDSLDPTKFASTGNILMGFTVYDLLINRTVDLQPAPNLATEWSTRANASEWTFKLRQDVKFHSGKKFTADDVIYSFNRHLAPDSEAPTKAYLSQIELIEKKGPHTVNFILKSPNADFPIVMSDTRVHIVEYGWTDFSNNTSGTGPFKVKEFVAGSSYIFERNDDYWGSHGPYLEEIEFIGIGDLNARINALLSDDIQAMISLDPKLVPLIERNDKVSVNRARSGSHLNLAMMLDRKPTNDKDFRMALKYAIDREKIVKNVFKGYGHVGNDHPLSPIDPFYCDHIKQRTYDPDRARYHIKKAGLENTKIEIFGSDVPGAGGIASLQILQQSAAVAGIDLDVIQPPADSYWQSVWMKKPICVSGWDFRPTADLMFSIAYQSDGAYNETVWKNEKFDKLMLEARATTDFDKRKEIYCEMQSQLQDDGGVSILAFSDILDAHSNKLMGITPHSSGALGFYQFAKTAWLDA